MTETIPDEDFLYRKIVPEYWDDRLKNIKSSAFASIQTSVDWARYTTPNESINREPIGLFLARVQAKYPRHKGQEVAHDPQPANQSHSLIKGKKKESVRHYIRNHCEIILSSEGRPF